QGGREQANRDCVRRHLAALAEQLHGGRREDGGRLGREAVGAEAGRRRHDPPIREGDDPAPGASQDLEGTTVRGRLLRREGDGVDAGPNGDLRTSGRKWLGQDVDPRRLAADEAWRGLDDPDVQQVLEAPPDPDDELAGPDRGEEQVRGATEVPDNLVRDRLVALDAERVVI